MYIIAYPNNDNLSIIVPCNDDHIESVAKRDVPYGLPYKILLETDLPKDRIFRDAWECDFSNPDGYGESNKS